ncbi:hypothetical protein KXQ82_01335 [Mucilaginibacter sp. HMF5004]|uniref:Kelch repeat-containing protein n=1 Tax=Mucilaginibacter rivuli TaxID=2857527 RepID=UPI001C5E5DF2|nr:kelch repeat-containing protein [Mucilaginibacter rivuli]MBW4888332.1 hypothetical protein [Mucilaginibacter rivuli]
MKKAVLNYLLTLTLLIPGMIGLSFTNNNVYRTTKGIADIIIFVKNNDGKAIPNATFINNSKAYTLLFDSTGRLNIARRHLDTGDEISITCIGYTPLKIKGIDILTKGTRTFVLEYKQILLGEVKIKNSAEKLVFKNVSNLPFPLYYEACTSDGHYGYTVSGLSGRSICTQALKYDPQSNNWSLLAHDLKPTIQATSAYIPSNGKIYVIGGITSTVNYTYFENVETIDTKTGKVELLKVKNPLPTAYAGSAVWNNKIYVFGGGTGINNMTSSVAVNSFYEFDPVMEAFNKLPDMPEKLQTSGTVINGILYVFGGFNPQGNYTSSNIYSYDIQNKVWALIGKLPKPISANGITACNDLIFIAGGYDDKDAVGFFNTQTRQFTVVKSNFSTRKHLGAIVIYNHIMVIGGSNAIYNTGVSTVQIADLKDILTRAQ